MEPTRFIGYLLNDDSKEEKFVNIIVSVSSIENTLRLYLLCNIICKDKYEISHEWQLMDEQILQKMNLQSLINAVCSGLEKSNQYPQETVILIQSTLRKISAIRNDFAHTTNIFGAMPTEIDKAYSSFDRSINKIDFFMRDIHEGYSNRLSSIDRKGLL